MFSVRIEEENASWKISDNYPPLNLRVLTDVEGHVLKKVVAWCTIVSPATQNTQIPIHIPILGIMITKRFHRMRHGNRRQFLSTSIAAAVAPMTVPSHVLGRAGAVAPSNKLTLGVIGIGPRCTYNLSAMLKFEDVQTVAIADVQASRRDAGKQLVDKHYANAGCAVYRDQNCDERLTIPPTYAIATRIYE